MYSLQYSMLPIKRAGILELWQRINEAATEDGAAKEEKHAKGANGLANGHSVSQSE